VPDYLHSAQLFATSLVTITDWCCRPPEPHFGNEEESSGYVLVFPRTGAYVERRADNDNLIADPSRLVLFNAGEVYRVAHPVSGGDDCTAIRFDTDALLNYARSHHGTIKDDSRVFGSPSVANTNAMALVLHGIRRSVLVRRQPNKLLVEENATALLNQAMGMESRQCGLKPEAVRADTRKAHRDLVYAARIALAKRFREKLSLSEIARAVFSSPFHLARIFRRETGTSLHAHQTQLRLREALNEIADGVRDLTALALDLGFSSHAHFSFAFQRHFRASPSQIRQQLSSARLRELSRNPKAANATSS
jgi:AraC family transcriptional regulator